MYYFQVSFGLKVILQMVKVTQNTMTLLSNARQFYSSKGNHLGTKGLKFFISF